MTNDEQRLKWQCRRGMLELDLLLNNFVDQRAATLNDEEQQVFSRLLDYPDQVLLDLLLGRAVSSDPAIARLVNAIQSTGFLSG